MRFEGTYTAMVTPFDEDGAFDYDALANLVEEQIAAGISGLVVLGTTGESPTVTPKEHNEVIKFVIDRADGRTQVIAGTGSNNTEEAIEYSLKAREDGADGLLLVTPYYNKPTQRGLIAHFERIANTVDLPQMLYNIKGRTAINIGTETLLELAAHENIVAVKEASGDINQIMDVIAGMPAGFTVLSGDDNMTWPLLALGGHGVVSVVSNIVPRSVIELVEAGRSGDLEAARRKHFELLPLMRACFIETNPIPIKTMLALAGKVKEQFRLPLCPMAPGNRQKLEAILAQYDIA